jgi:hypothetical protein
MCTTGSNRGKRSSWYRLYRGERGVIVQQRVGRRGSAVEIVEESLLGTLQGSKQRAQLRLRHVPQA